MKNTFVQNDAGCGQLDIVIGAPAKSNRFALDALIASRRGAIAFLREISNENFHARPTSTRIL